MKKYKVLWFSPTDIASDASSEKRGWVNSLLNEIKEEIELHVAVIEGVDNQPIAGVTKHVIKARNRKLRQALHLLYGHRNIEGNLIESFKELIDRIQPDLVHLHGSEKQYIQTIPYLNSRGIPHLVSLQGIVSIISSKYIAGYSKRFVHTFITHKGFSRSSILPKTNANIYAALRRHAAVEDRILQSVQNFAGRTEWDASIAALLSPKSNYYKVDRAMKAVYYENHWDKLRVIDKEVIIHTTTGNSYYKGFEVIAEAAYLLQRSGFLVKWQIAGLTSKDWSVRAAKRKLNKRFNDSAFVFLGNIGADEMVKNMKEADIYVTASHIENSPNNLAEAQLLGMPCIATDVGGTSSYLTNNETGVLIPSADPYRLAGAIKSLSENFDLRGKLANKSRLVALERHNKQAIKANLLSAYNSIIDSKKNI